MNDALALPLILIPALPLAAAILVACLGPKLLKEHSHWPVIIAFAGSFLCSATLFFEVRSQNNAETQPAGFEYVVNLWNWANVENAITLPRSPVNESELSLADEGPRSFRIDVCLRVDALTSMMLCMVTFISTLVAIFASGYMHGERGYWRFFCYIAIFVFSMTMLVSVSNFVLLFVFWEAVGACSYLLIGFWYQKPEAAAAGVKAFLVNRVGDFGFACGLFLLWTTYGSLNFHDTTSDGVADAKQVQAAYELALQQRTISPSDEPAATEKTESKEPTLVRGVLGQSRILGKDYRTGGIALAICLLLLVGACGKSAQFPLHVWLPDAMEGPTPVSALIHAATMVTAGVYMVTRCSPLFFASPEAQVVVAGIGGFTSILAALIALTQWDLKRVMAYSTLSQLGYMFLALGVGTFAGVTAGMFHLFTHAFFKALLFLGAGSVMHAMHHIIDMRQFSGLRKVLPYTHATFLIGCLALAGVFPLAGFWSKDSILGAVADKMHEIDHEFERRHGEGSGIGGQGSEKTEHSQLGASGETFVSTRLADESHGHGPYAEWTDAQLTRYGRIYFVLFWSGIFTAFLTAFYTFRAYCLTFWGEEKIPEAAGHHAHESPINMTAPLIVLAVCSVLVGAVMVDWTDLGHSFFNDFLGNAPSLASPAVVATKAAHPHFHTDVAGYSTIAAFLGIGLACYFYLGHRKEAEFVRQVTDLEGADRITTFNWIGRLPQIGWIGWTTGMLQRSGLGFLTTAVTILLGFVWLIVAIPILLVQFFTPYRLSQNKFYIDELYSFFIVWPLRICAYILAWLDKWVLDGLVNLVGYVPRLAGAIMRDMHQGLVQFYALVMVVGVVVILLVGQWFAR